jgi:hypothetical protein
MFLCYYFFLLCRFKIKHVSKVQNMHLFLGTLAWLQTVNINPHFMDLPRIGLNLEWEILTIMGKFRTGVWGPRAIFVKLYHARQFCKCVLVHNTEGENLNLKKGSFTRNLCSVQGPARNEPETSQYIINIPTPASRQWKGKIEKIKFVRSNNKTINLACDLKKVMLFLLQ